MNAALAQSAPPAFSQVDVEPEPQENVREAIRMIAVIVIAWNVAGWLLSYDPASWVGFWNMASWRALAPTVMSIALTAGFVRLEMKASVQFLRAMRRAEIPLARLGWLCALIACSLWSMYSADRAFVMFTGLALPASFDLAALVTIVLQAPVFLALTAAAFIVPLLPAALEAVERAPVLPVSLRSIAGGKSEPRGTRTLGLLGGLAMAGALSAAGGEPAHALAAPAPITEPASPVRQASRPAKSTTNAAPNYELARQLVRQNVATKEIIERTNVSRAQIKRYRAATKQA